MQSIEHTLRALDRTAADEQQQLQRLDKTLTDYQAQLNAVLDLDKSDTQVAEAPAEPDLETAALPCRTQSVTPGAQPNSLPAPIP